MSPEMSQNVPVYFEGELLSTVNEARLMVGFPANEGTGCYKAGRENHLMLRQNKYSTFCVCKDCDWKI